MKLKDPNGYYAILGVSPEASINDIKRAFRNRAKELHPDSNRDSSSSAAFQRLHEAYRVLSDSAARARYDTYAASFSAQAEDDRKQETREQAEREEPVEPLRCSICGVVTAQPRYIVYWQVISFIVTTVRQPVQGIFCRRCADRKALRASLITWLLGWWGIPFGPILSVATLFRNLWGGSKPADANAALLGQQAVAFASRGDIPIASALVEDAIRFARDYTLRERLAALRMSINPTRSAKPLADRWRPWASSAFMIQLTPLAVAVCVGTYLCLSLISEGNTSRAFTAPAPVVTAASGQPAPVPASSPRVTPRPETASDAELWHVATERLNMRAGPGTQHPVVQELPRFTTVQVLELSSDFNWVRVRTATGLVGYVNLRYLARGAGAATPQQVSADTCGDAGIYVPNNAVLVGASRGPHILRIRNGSQRDAFVVARNSFGRPVAGFYVASASVAEVHLPDGVYVISFATGDRFSRSCLRFMSDMDAQRFPGTETLQTTRQGNYEYYSELEFTLHNVIGGNIRPRDMPIDDFLNGLR